LIDEDPGLEVHTAVLLTAALLSATHEIRTGDSPSYGPEGLRVAVGDTVRWSATERHPLAFDGESGGPYDSGSYERTLTEPGQVAFFCMQHGGPGGDGMSGLVTVGDANQPPAVTLEPTDTGSFRALASDPERIALRLAWDLDGDGAFEIVNGGVSASASYGPGTHTVRVRATDDRGLQAEARLQFMIPGPPPVASPTTMPGPAPPAPPAQATPSASLRAAAPDAIRRATLRRRGLRVTVTPAADGWLSVELRDTRGRRLARATRTARAGVVLILRLRAPRARAGRLRLLVTGADGLTVTRGVTVRA
jgi:plastocyanin